MEGEVRTTDRLQFPSFQVELVRQERSGPFRRVHRLDRPSLVYMRPVRSDHARGCFGDPRSHQSYTRLGTAVAVPSHMPLHMISSGFPDREMVIARFDEDRFASLTGIGEQASAKELAACADVRARAVIDVLERLSLEMSQPSVVRETVVAGLGLVLLGELARYLDQSRKAKPAVTGQLAQWQVKRIADRLSDEHRPLPDVNELAALCGIGRRHLMRAFKATMGMTVMEHVDRVAFARAIALLGEASLPLKTIANQLGYECQGSFSMAFRRRMGESPSNFRLRHSGKHFVQ